MAGFNLNKAIIAGNLTAEPELKQTANGVLVMTFSLAIHRRCTKGEDQKTDFLQVVAWRQSAEFLSRYAHKGDCVSVIGSIQTRSWSDNTGRKQYATEIIADEVQIVTGKKPQNSGNETGASEDAPQFEEVPGGGDLPF